LGLVQKNFGALPNVSYEIVVEMEHFSKIFDHFFGGFGQFSDFRAISSLLFSLAKNVLKSRIFGPSKPDLRLMENRLFLSIFP